MRDVSDGGCAVGKGNVWERRAFVTLRGGSAGAACEDGASRCSPAPAAQEQGEARDVSQTAGGSSECQAEGQLGGRAADGP